MEIYAIIWTKSAELDLESIIEYIKLENKEIAKKIFFEIKNECQKLHYFPYRKKIIPELQNIGIMKYRELIYKRWRIVFKVQDKKVIVLAVLDSSRNIEEILFQRLIKS